MEAIFPITALQKRTSDVKSAAHEGVVRITEQGAAAYVFCTEEVLESVIEKAVNEALFEYEMERALRLGSNDVVQGNYLTDTGEALIEAKARAAQRISKNTTACEHRGEPKKNERL